MACEVCGKKMQNCECTPVQRELHDENEPLEWAIKDMREKLTTLIASWKERAAGSRHDWYSHSDTYDVCADELQDVLKGNS